MALITLSRSGKPPIRFDGESIAAATSRAANGPLQNRWHEAEVYETDVGQYVVRIAYRTQWQRELPHEHVEVAGTPVAAAAIVTAYDPVAHVAGFPDGEQYASRQAKLHAAIRAGWDKLVSELLDDDRFAVTPADARDLRHRVDVRVHLLNSAMMPQPGSYRLVALTQSEFADAVRAASANGSLKSYVGYQQTADYIQRISGIEIPVSRDQTVLADGDEMLIIRLRYRVAAPGTKGQSVPEEFKFFRAEYRR